MPRVFHFSEEPDITVFVPRPPRAHPGQEPLVWAIDEWHAPHYLLPRDCPRACFWALPESHPNDIERYLRGAKRVIAIEPVWLERVRSARMFRYEFDPARFEPIDDSAGYWVSRHVVRPLDVVAIDDLPAAIEAAGIEFRVEPDLMKLHLAVVDSTLDFSSMRLRNAQDYVA